VADRQSDVERAVEELGTIATERSSRAARAKRAADLIRRTGRYRWVGIYDVDAMEISVIAWSGPTAPAFPRFPVTRGLSGDAVRTGKPIVVGDVSSDPRYLTTFGTTKSEIVLPVFGGDSNTVVGTLDVESDAAHAFADRDTAMLERFAAALVPLWIDQ
jgi:putative methionine-R-sulfoxide reductase with GAF domain